MAKRQGALSRYFSRRARRRAEKNKDKGTIKKEIVRGSVSDNYKPSPKPASSSPPIVTVSRGGSRGGSSSRKVVSSRTIRGPSQQDFESSVKDAKGTVKARVGDVKPEQKRLERKAELKSYTESEKAKVEIARIEGQKDVREKLNIETPELFQKAEEEELTRLSSKTQSFQEVPTYGLSSGLGFKDLDVTAEEYQAQRLGGMRTAYQESFQRDVSGAVGRQQDIEQGRLDSMEFQTQAEADAAVEAANKRLEEFQASYIEDWQTGKGAALERTSARVMTDVALETQSIERIRGIGGQLKVGAITGAGVTAVGAGIAAVSAPAAGFVGSVGLGVGGGLLGYEYYKAGKGGSKAFEEFKEMGFTEKEAKYRAALVGANIISPTAFTGLGAVAGGGLVYGGIKGFQNVKTTGRVTGISKSDRAVIERLTSRGDIYKETVTSGKITDAQAKALGIDVSQKGSFSVKQTRIGFDPAKMTGKEFKILQKTGFRGERFEVIGQTGKTFRGFDVTKTKLGGFGNRPQVSYSEFGGTIGKGGQAVGTRYVVSDFGKGVGDFRFGAETLTGKGTITRTGGLRVETGKGFSSRVAEFDVIAGRPETIRLGGDVMKVRTGNIAEFTRAFAGIDTNVGAAYSGSQFRVLGGGSRAAPGQKGLFTFERGTGAKLGYKPTDFSSFTSSGAGTGTQLVTSTTTPSVQISPPTTIRPTIAPPTQVGVIASPYAGTGRYETTIGPTGRLGLDTMRVSGGLKFVEEFDTTVTPVTGAGFRDLGKTRTGSRRRFIQPVEFVQSQPQIQTPRVGQKQPQRQLIGSRLKPGQTIGFPGFGSNFVPSFGTGAGVGFGIPPLVGGDFGGLARGRKLPGKRGYKYTPSFGAIAAPFIDRPKAPRTAKSKKKKGKRYTGLEFRPITRGFKWFK